MNTIEMIQYINERYNNKYITDKLEFKNNKTPFKLICTKHGEFEITRNAILLSKLKSACPICKKEERGEVYDTNSCIKKIESRFGINHFDLSQVNYKGYRSKITVGCKNGHGFFDILPDRLYVYGDCPQCSLINKAKKQLLSIEEYINKAKIVHNNFYSYGKISNYLGLLNPITITCPDHGDFEQLAGNHLSGKGCIKCSVTKAKAEKEVKEWLETENIKCKPQYRNKYELDIYLPDYKIGIEYNGLYWHSEIHKDKNYHWDKSQHFEKLGIRVIHIWEDEWKHNQNKIKSYIKYQLGLNKEKIYARKCEIKTITSKEANKLYNKYHLLGNTRAKIYKGLYYNEKLVAVAAFTDAGSNRGNYCWELIRYAATCSVVGGLGKLVQNFAKEISSNIISYTDNDKFSGDSYSKAGFIFVNYIKPDYKTFSSPEKTRKSKQYTKLSNLQKILKDKFNPNLTEHQNCLNNKIYRVYDSGKKKWIFSLE